MRTMSRNIKLTSATDVTAMTTSRRSIRTGANGSGMPAITEPMVMSTAPDSMALMAPETLKPTMSSRRVIGVTR